MAKTTQELHGDMRTLLASRSTDQLIRDYEIGSCLSRAANSDPSEGAAWVVTLVAIGTELDERGIETCDICGWPAGDHDPELCPAAGELA